MENSFLDDLYTLTEIGIHNGMERSDLRTLSVFMNDKDVRSISINFPELKKFLPHCDWFVVDGKNVLAMSAWVYDMYSDTGLLPDLMKYDKEPDIEKLEHWQYIAPLVVQINPDTGFEFAKDIFPDCNIWNLFLAGCARMDYYEGRKTPIEQRIKYAIAEYMTRRPQFFNTHDFYDNDVLHRKYKKKGVK